MNSDNANQLSNEFEATLSKILPDLVHLLQQYQVSNTLEIHLEPRFLDAGTMASCNCCWDGRRYRCGSPGYGQNQHSASGLDPEKTEQLGKDIQSKLSTVVKGLSGSVDQANNTFSVHLVVDLAVTSSEQSLVCQWDNNSSQGGILRCSNS